VRRLLLIYSFIALILPTAAGAQTTSSSASEPTTKNKKSIDDVAKQLNNPVADLWALNFQFYRYYLQGEPTDRTREQDVLNFQSASRVSGLVLAMNWAVFPW